MTEPPTSLTSLGGMEEGFCMVEAVKTKSKTILHRMALDFPESAVTAIMGPSGSGMRNGGEINEVRPSLLTLLNFT